MFQLILVLVLLIPILAIVLDSRVGQALAARLEGRDRQGTEELLGDRVAYLENEVERLNGELLRLDEESEFLHKLLAERQEKAEGLPPVPSEAPDEGDSSD